MAVSCRLCVRNFFSSMWRSRDAIISCINVFLSVFLSKLTPRSHDGERRGVSTYSWRSAAQNITLLLNTFRLLIPTRGSTGGEGGGTPEAEGIMGNSLAYVMLLRVFYFRGVLVAATTAPVSP